MTTLLVPLGDRTYPIVVTCGALAGPHLDKLPDEVALISCSTVSPLYGEAVATRLEALGTRVLRFDLPDGERAKSWRWASQAYDALAGFGLSRRGAVVAVGGGVVGDLAGFVAGTWMRGIQFVQIPTTLLAMVDSSVGGKTGINHPRAKNLIGVFHQPSMVLIDPTCLQTLPARQFSSGMAEIIKHGVITDLGLFEWLEDNMDEVMAHDPPALQQVILRCCDIKARVVGSDERESDSVGRRAILNYGHTVGHALEAIAGYGDFLHGEAVSIGMTVAVHVARETGTIAEAEGRLLLDRQTELLQRAALPTSLPPVDFEALAAAMVLDKKNRGQTLTFMLPTRMGEVQRVSGVPLEAVRRAVAACTVATP